MQVKVKFNTAGLKSFGPRDARPVESGEVVSIDDAHLLRYPTDAYERVEDDADSDADNGDGSKTSTDDSEEKKSKGRGKGKGRGK